MLGVIIVHTIIHSKLPRHPRPIPHDWWTVSFGQDTYFFGLFQILLDESDVHLLLLLKWNGDKRWKFDRRKMNRSLTNGVPRRCEYWRVYPKFTSGVKHNASLQYESLISDKNLWNWIHVLQTYWKMTFSLNLCFAMLGVTMYSNIP